MMSENESFTCTQNCSYFLRHSKGNVGKIALKIANRAMSNDSVNNYAITLISLLSIIK